MKSISISEQFAALHAQMVASAEHFPPCKTKAFLFERAKEFRPFVRLSAKYPDATAAVLANAGLTPESLLNNPNRGNRIIRGIILSVATGENYMRRNVESFLAYLLEALPYDPKYRTESEFRNRVRSYGDTPMCKSEFDVVSYTLKLVNVVAYQFRETGESPYMIANNAIAKSLVGLIGKKCLQPGVA